MLVVSFTTACNQKRSKFRMDVFTQAIHLLLQLLDETPESLISCVAFFVKQNLSFMETNKRLYYTDGHDVMITDSGFRVKNSLYQLNGITRHGFSIISPHRTPYAIMMILGAVIFICGAFRLFPSSWMYSAVILKFQVAADSLVMTLGSVVFGLGMLTMLRVREKY